MINATTPATPAHLPRRLTISLWDFSWYTMTMPGEPFDNLDRAFGEAVQRGYNTVRICAMPLFLFETTGRQRPGPLHLTNLGDGFGQRTRWYNCRGGATLDGHAHLLSLFRAAKRHNCFVILSSWEYQQSPSFLATPELHQALLAIPPQERFMALAQSLAHLIQFLKDHDLADRIAYTELHNEVEYSKLTAIARPGEDPYAAMNPFVEEAVGTLRAQHPDILMTASYARPPVYRLRHLAANMQVAHVHLYIYGVLEELFQAIGLHGSEPFPNEATRAILRSDAPPFAAWTPPAGQEWRLAATGINRSLFYVHDWADPDKWDLWLYERYGAHREAMRQDIQQRLAALADWAGQHGIPSVIGEGYVGYTPLLAGFEEGPVGKDIAAYAIEACLCLNVWGVILCSNAAPHHPFWQDVAWQQTWNRRIREHQGGLA